MRVYFVRHGESEENVQRINFGGEALLTEHGERQAAFVAKRLKNIPNTRIIASTFVRAQQTAKIISECLGLPVESSELFVERRYPTGYAGEHYDSQFIQEYTRQRKENGDNPDWKYSDDESFNDLKQRALEALRFIGSHSDEHLVVVSHSIFMRMLMMCMIFGEELEPAVFRKFSHATPTANTGITIADYGPCVSCGKTHWKLISWNDHAHLP
ncbi:MAG: hypothetical protein A2675_03685 [Candidatus Yonathbacteria bacterium RIFCSPHIGHO2_01_FULL_51_10]|uniref:Phosphoglycerate mutase n=1 Tax=Candidatus Yonathbacteria bacterium RIFCSPHIGHO2_01_FULL_51_10 TaxID=1802723 RepID=A0A1G2SA57_9BACT|nr:MAG: hypothetical protein A2675_03685 [Candidatus Yonathbacteria bacterium RIFCSPHIGHO2_01_FULL_51_10]